MSLPDGVLGRSAVVEAVSLRGERPVLLAGGGEPAELAVLHGALADPVDVRVVADRVVERVDQDDLVVLVSRVLVDEVRVEDTEVRAPSARSLLGVRPERADSLLLQDTLCSRLAVDDALGDQFLSPASGDAHAVDDVALLGLVPELSGSVDAGRLAGAVDSREVAELPASDAEQEAHDIRLLLLVQFRQILVRTHGGGESGVCVCVLTLAKRNAAAAHARRGRCARVNVTSPRRFKKKVVVCRVTETRHSTRPPRTATAETE